MNKTEVLRLANLARIKLSDIEAEKLSHEFEAILGYVGEVKEISSQETRDKKQDTNEFPVRNVMREDGEGHRPGIYTEKILAAAPSREKNFIKVKKIL